ncbi:hypothetical protein [Lentilactobacillus kosonis]|uniref:Bifunctional protein: zinc-containing alcohol dehydrogenase, quinone oxidoreductase n=1 Tax=Lentilactobacillus kosonis TaxID=2810561 RepID=A0A401FHV4_9LACO|nr:hypothetical protein [Lentilactobacillus kosonis]GAY71944.1 bifunctional protein: zinc-containing alcohol dehydrogenase, quinone oxidoreductase [Lentilactobacillus kosonis]
MRAVIQKDFNGIDSIQIVNLPEPKGNIIGRLVDVKYVPVLPWDIKNEAGLLTQMHNDPLPRILGYGFSGTIHDQNLIWPSKGTRVVVLRPMERMRKLLMPPFPHTFFLCPTMFH